MTNPYAAHLDTLRLDRAARVADERSVFIKGYADRNDEHPALIEVPGPGAVARHWLTRIVAEVMGKTFVSKGNALHTLAPDGTLKAVDMLALSQALVAILGEQQAEGEAAEALRFLCRTYPDAAGVYTLGVLRRARADAPAYREPVTESQRGPTMDDRERARASRADRKARAEETARAFLASYEVPPRGVPSTTLWEHAQTAIAEWCEMASPPAHLGARARREERQWWLDEGAAEYGSPIAPVLPGRTHFMAVAAEVLDKRRRAAGAVFVARNDTDAILDAIEGIEPSTTTETTVVAA